MHNTAAESPKSKLVGCYDLEVAPETFDVFGFVVLLKTQFECGSFTNISVIVVPGIRNGFRSNDQTYQLRESHWRLHKLVYPLFEQLLPEADLYFFSNREDAKQWIDALDSVDVIIPEDYAVSNPTSEFSVKALQSAWKHTKYQPVFNASELACDYIREWLGPKEDFKGIVSITLRQNSSFLSRNSDLDAWKALCVDLRNRCYIPVVVPDTASISEARGGFEDHLVCDLAAYELSIRHALYEVCDLNLFVNNGPAMFAYYGDSTPYLCFKLVSNDTSVSNFEYFAKEEFLPGSQWPGAVENQYLIWEDDSENILRITTNLMLDRMEGISPGNECAIEEMMLKSIRSNYWSEVNALSSWSIATNPESLDAYLFRVKSLVAQDRREEAFYTLKQMLTFSSYECILKKLKDDPSSLTSLSKSSIQLLRHAKTEENWPPSVEVIGNSEQFLEIIQDLKCPIAVFGAGTAGVKVIALCQKQQIHVNYVFDNDFSKWGMQVGDTVISAPDQLHHNLFLVIASMHWKAIVRDLYAQHVDLPENIYALDRKAIHEISTM